jgi:pyruvate dehydrogenase E1 component
MGEGLQHDDGHSHVLSSVIPSCVSYDPTYAYELAVIVQSGMRRMFVEQEDIYYYITLLNEGYPQPPMPAGVEDGIIQGAYLLKQSETTNQESPRAQLVASGAIMREALAAAELLAADFGVASDIWSATSLSELRRNGMAAERWNLLHPEDPPKVPYIQSLLAAHPGPVVVVTDYMKIVGDQIKPFLPDRTFIALGTDGFGRSDTREALREFFEVNRHFIALAALKLLADEGRIARSEVNRAMALYGIAPDKPDPAAVK